MILSVLVTRNLAERQETVNESKIVFVGADKDKIVNECFQLKIDKEKYIKMSVKSNPYGDAETFKKILNKLISVL